MKSEHFHKYERQIWPNKKIFYKCVLPNCSHYLPLASLVIGRESKCWGFMCDNLLTITKEDVAKGIKHPMCSMCKEKRKEQKEALAKI